jgi:transcription elongation GreA/GreB family factor
MENKKKSQAMNLREQAIEILNEILSQQEFDIKQSIELTKESRDGEQKSTSGDKHETSRATTQHELDKYEAQLNKTQQLQAELNRVKQVLPSTKVTTGSYVITNEYHYFISVGIGKVQKGETKFFAISLASPIGKLLQGKTLGEKFIFQQKETEIIAVY